MAKMMQVFDIQDCPDEELRSWAISFLLNTATYQHGNDSYIQVYVSTDPDNDDCFFSPRRYYQTSREDAKNLVKMRAWMESEGLVYKPFPDEQVLIRVWW